MEQTVFRNLSMQTSDISKSPRKKHTIFRTRRKFGIKKLLNVSTWIMNHIQFRFLRPDSPSLIKTSVNAQNSVEKTNKERENIRNIINYKK
jgi:hypothetical protein